MTKLLEEAIKKVRELPDADQDEAAEILLSVASKNTDVVELDAETRAAIREGREQARQGKFVSDKDSKSWTISNPDAVKGHEGHHVTLTAHVYADKNEVHVMSLKMAK